MQGDPVESFLLMKHKSRWDLPKGHIDPGETDIECALREMEEETGISRASVAIDPDFDYRNYYYVRSKRTNGKLKLKELRIYLGRVEHQFEIDLTEHIGFEWVPWSPPHTIQEFTIDPLLESVREFIQSGS